VRDSLFTHTECIVDYNNSNPQCIPFFFLLFYFFFHLFFPNFPFFLFFFQNYFPFFPTFPFFVYFFFKIIFVDFFFLILSWLKISLCNFFSLKYCEFLRCFPTWFFFFIFLFFKIIFVDFIFFNIELIENLGL